MRSICLDCMKCEKRGLGCSDTPPFCVIRSNELGLEEQVTSLCLFAMQCRPMRFAMSSGPAGQTQRGDLSI